MAAQGNQSTATVAVRVPAVGATPPALETRWGRLLIPSFTDLFVLALIVWMFCFGSGWKGLLEDGDTGWHLRTGQYILSTHTVPTHDLYSFSKANEPWFAWEWLTDVIYAALYNWSGLKGIVLLSGVLIVGSVTVLIRHMLWRGANGFISFGLAVMMIEAASIHFHARPHVVTLFLFPISLWLIDADRRAPSNRVWILVPLTVLWTNLHGGFLALIASLGLLVMGSAIEAALEWGRAKRFDLTSTLRYSGLLAACGAATFVNPYGWGLHKHVFAYLGSDWIRDTIMEFQSPTFRSEGMLMFELLLFGGAMTCAAMLARGRVIESLWILYWGHASLTSARHVPLYAIVAAPFVATELTRLWQNATSGLSKTSVFTLLNDMSVDFTKGFQRTTIWLGIFLGVFAVLGAPIQWPKDFSDVRFPTKMIAAHEAWMTSGKLFTTDQWGDYLIYRYYPNVKVFVDGRSDFYGPDIGKQYLKLWHAEPGWDETLKRNGFNKVFVPVDWSLVSVLKQRSDWKVVADDGKSILFERRDALGTD